MSNALSNVVSISSWSVAKLNASAKRPRPILRRASEEDLAWDPVALEQHVVVDGQNVRSGESYAICRPGHERWPLGHVSDHYRPVSHRLTAEAIKTFCAGSVAFAGALIFGHGYHVAHSYDVRHMQAGSVAGAPVIARLVVASSHTGGESLKAAMVVYVGRDAIGAVVRSKALHVAGQPERWQGDVDGMIEKAILVQDVLIDLLRAASERVLDDADKAFFARKKMNIKDDARTALDAVRSWTRGRNKAMSWGTWSRRLDDEAIRALVGLLGRSFGEALDAAFGTIANYSRAAH